MSTYKFKACFTGRAFESDVSDFTTTRRIKESFCSIVEKMTAIHLGRNELACEIKEHIHYSMNINKGVLELDVDFDSQFFKIFNNEEEPQEQLSFVDQIARLFYSSVSLRKYIVESHKLGKPARVFLNVQNDADQCSVIRTEKGNILLKHPKILWAAQMTRSDSDAILGLMDNGLVTGFEFFGLNKPFHSNAADTVVIGQSQADLTATASFEGRLDNLMLSQQRGVVVSSNEVFQVVWNKALQSKVLQYADLDNVEFIAKPCVESHSLYGELIVYQILDCNVQQMTTTETVALLQPESTTTKPTTSRQVI